MSYKTLAQNDAVNQRLYLAVINDTGVEQPQYGKVEIKLGDIRDLFSNALAGTRTPAAGFTSDDCATVKLREVQVCLDDGTQAFAIVLMGAPYTKS